MIDLDSLDGIEINESDSHTQHQQQQQLAATADTHAKNLTEQQTITIISEQQKHNKITSQQRQLFDLTPMSQGNANLLTCMLITANVGTIFEESTLLELWLQQLKSYLIKIKPQLVAIHCQEVGGKNYESSMKNVSNFTDKIICDQAIVCDYSRVRVFLDENFKNLEKFTALGSLYLIHDSVNNVKLYNFKTAQYEPIVGRIVLAGENNNDWASNNNQQDSISITTTSKTIADTNNTGCQTANRLTTNNFDFVEKVKFPQDLFPECRWSRKGFMRTRWLFNDSQPLDLVNIHLFHDASNLVAMEKTPSPYAQNRQRALDFALKRLSIPLEGSWRPVSQLQEQDKKQLDVSMSKEMQQRQQQQQVPMFIFGDFNFRLNTSKVIQRITDGMSPIIKRSADSKEVLEIVYHRKSSSNIKPDQGQLSSNSQESKKRKETSSDMNSSANPCKVHDDDGNSNYLEGDGVVMTVGKKLFDCENLDEMFRATKNTEWLLELDNELDSFKKQLYEFKISFSPSYPFKEDVSGSHSYMKTRCPAWCDRILFNAAGNRMIHCKGVDITNMDSEKRIEVLQNQGDVIYRLMGNSVPMGDHKPVLLYCKLNLSPQPSQTKCNLPNTMANEPAGSSIESTEM